MVQAVPRSKARLTERQQFWLDVRTGRLCNWRVDEAFTGKILNDGVENPVDGIRRVAGDGGDLERTTEPRQFIAMQKIRRRCLGAKHLVRVDRRRRFRFPLGNAGEFYEGVEVGVLEHPANQAFR